MIQKSRGKLGFMILVAALAGLTYFFIRSNIFIIKSVEVKAEKIVCTDTNQIQQSSNLLGQHLMLFDSKKIINSLKSKFLCIRDVQLVRNLPDKINILATGRDAKALVVVLKNREATLSAEVENIATPSAREQEVLSSFLADEEGIIFSKESNGYIGTKIYYNGDLTLSQTRNLSISDSLKILEKIKEFGVDVKESEILDNMLIVYPMPRIAFNLKANLDTQLASLQLILNKAKIDNESLRFVDLRFDKPVIRLAPKI